MTDTIRYLLSYLHTESLEAWEERTVSANKERRNGTRPGPDDKPKRRYIVKDEKK